MRIDVLLRATSAEETIKFYVQELKIFQVDTDFGMDSYLLRAIANADLCLQITPWHPEPVPQARFALSVQDCDVEFARLRQTPFASGGGLVPDKNGKLAVFEWAGGKNFLLEDPGKNRFLLFEDYISQASP